MTDGSGVRFDRAAEYYDRTRALPAEVQRQVVDFLLDQLSGRGPCVDVGVGTGRIALPVGARGVRVTGIDVSHPMLRKLLGKRGDVRLDVLVADATRLPFAAGSFGAALTSHVLHLIPRWRDALAEMVRVLRPGGVALIDAGGLWPGWLGDLFGRFCQEAGLGRAFLGASDPTEVTAAMVALGASERPVPPITGTTTMRPAEAIDRLESGMLSFAWPIEERDRRIAAAATAAWARSALGPLDEPHRLEMKIRWQAFDLPAGRRADRTD